MGKKDFSDWLIVSDVDGTLINKKRKTPLVNLSAIKRFVKESGGNFTLASARGAESLGPHYRKLPGVKTPAIVLNGAGIYDYEKEKMLWFNPVPSCAVEIVNEAMRRFPLLEIGVFTEDMIYLVRPRILSVVMMKLDNLTHKKCSSYNDVPSADAGKIIFFCLPWQKKQIKDFVTSRSDDSLAYVDTTSMSFDMLNATTNKGNAIKVLAEILGVPMKNTCGIGDYYNDVDMFKAVGHAACCGNSPDELEELCEYRTCHCNDGAVADFIGYIEKNYGN